MRPGRSWPTPVTPRPVAKKGRARPSSRLGSVAECSSDVALLRRWLAGAGVPSGLGADTDFRWLLLVPTWPGAAWSTRDPRRAEEADPTFGGRLAALQARASQPTEAAKRPGRGARSSRRTHAVQPPARRAAAGFLVDAGRRPRAAVRQPVLRRGPAAVGMGRGRRAGPSGAVRFPRVVERATLAAGQGALWPERRCRPRRAATSSTARPRSAEAVVSRERYAPGRVASERSSSGSW